MSREQERRGVVAARMRSGPNLSRSDRALPGRWGAGLGRHLTRPKRATADETTRARLTGATPGISRQPIDRSQLSVNEELTLIEQAISKKRTERDERVAASPQAQVMQKVGGVEEPLIVVARRV